MRRSSSNRRQRRGNRFGRDAGVNPMESVSNLSDVMLILAVGIMLALVVRWNVDITPPNVETETNVNIDDADAVISEEDMEDMAEDAVEDSGLMEKRGELYYDEESGMYYIIQTEE